MSYNFINITTFSLILPSYINMPYLSCKYRGFYIVLKYKIIITLMQYVEKYFFSRLGKTADPSPLHNCTCPSEIVHNHVLQPQY